jgi:hypothetical protein
MRAGVALTVAGVVIGLAATIVAIVFLFQPWRSCDYEDTAMGCAMLPADAAVMMAALAAAPVGLVLTVVGVVLLVRRGRLRTLGAAA